VSAIQIYDTTLRDGTQREGLSLTVSDKLHIAELLDDLGVAYIEGGWPGSNPKDAEFFEKVRTLEFRHSRIAAFGSTCRVGLKPESDTNLSALLQAETPVVTIVGKTWTLHVEEVLRTTLAENLEQVSGIVEKPEPHKAPSTLAVVGRYILTPRIFHHLAKVQAGAGGEIQLTDGIAALIQEEKMLAYRFKGKRYDCGSKLGYLKAMVALGLKHPEVRDEFAAYLNGLK